MENGDQTLQSEDAQFYYSLGRQLWNQGYKRFDDVSIYSYLETKPTLKKKFDIRGGMSSVKELMELVNVENIEVNYDKIATRNYLTEMAKKNDKIWSDIEKLLDLSGDQVYDLLDYTINDLNIKAYQDIYIENLSITDGDVNDWESGVDLGLGYGSTCKILNHLTLGIPLGDLTMIGGHSGAGKTSFTFENIILSLVKNGVKCAVISNEQRSNDFKKLLMAHILTHDLNYWGLTRKKLKIGKFNTEQKDILQKAIDLSNTDYTDLKFVKLFDNDMAKVKKIIKKLSKLGYQAIMFDTMKSEDEIDDVMWQQLLIQSRKLFQLASKENIAIICTYQLALHTLNKRFIDASCLSNAKQIKEVFSEMIYLRPLWQDEYPGQKFDVKPRVYEKDDSGKYKKVAKIVNIDPTKKYIIAFLDKTRNDEDKQQVLYEFNGRYNTWKEIGYCSVINKHE